MKLLIIETCIVKGGKIAERGSTHDTGEVHRKEDSEAYDLISSGRAVALNDPEVPRLQQEIAAEKEQKAKGKR